MKPHVVFGTIAVFLASAATSSYFGLLPLWGVATLALVGAGSTGACAYLLSQGE